MQFDYLHLSEPWNSLYNQIADASRIFWQQADYQNHGRLQGDALWSLLQRKLQEMLDKLFGNAPLTSFEIFLLRAAIHLYESGWQVAGAAEFPIAQRYTLSGELIRDSYQQRAGAADLGLSKLEPATVETLARLCSSVGEQDLSELSLEPEWSGYQETARLRYLVALLQIGDALLPRQKAPYLYSLSRFHEEDEPRLALQPYASFTIEDGQITTHIYINPQDSHLLEKIIAIVEEPVRRWWAANWRWLAGELQIQISLERKPPRQSLLQTPLRKQCRILIPYLNTCQISAPLVPTAEEVQAACARAAAQQSSGNPIRQTSERLALPEAQADKKRAVEVFYSYSHKDSRYRDLLETHLKLLWREGLISEWSDRRIGAGQEWAGEIDEHLNTARIILLLVSPHFIASDYAYDIEMKQAMERHAAGEARVIPIILRHCDWHSAPFGKLQALPDNGKPVTDRSWHTLDEAFFQITQGIRKVVEQFSI
jgi:hypothetical protein